MSVSVDGPLSPYLKRPASSKRKKVAFKYKGREKSKNIEDRRNYFGSEATDMDYSTEDRFNDFVTDTIHKPFADAPQKFQRIQGS